MPSKPERGSRLDRYLGSACPKCGSSHAHRSHRRSVTDYILSLAGVWPYRCRKCRTPYRAVRWLRKLGVSKPWEMPSGSTVRPGGGVAAPGDRLAADSRQA